MIKSVCLLLVLGLMLLFNKVHAQTNNISDSTKVDTTKIKIIPLPLVYYTPETGLGLGAAGVLQFRFRNEPYRSRTSQIQFGAAYTLNNQFLFYLPYQLYLKDEQFSIYGELGYYIYNYFFYGIGNNVAKQTNENGEIEAYEELYDVNYPRLRTSILYQVKPNIYIGARYWFENFDVKQVEPGGRLETENIPGALGGNTSGAGPIINIDTRDNFNFSSEGVFVEAVAQFFRKSIGSDFNYTIYSLDASKYVAFKNKHVLAFNGYGVHTQGNPPFNQLALLGGTKKMRGLYLGRLRDKNLVLGQMEYRTTPVFWKVGFVGFVSYGGVAPTINDLSVSNFTTTYGGGARIRLTDDKLNIRLDYAFSEFEPAFYVTFSEAF